MNFLANPCQQGTLALGLWVAILNPLLGQSLETSFQITSQRYEEEASKLRALPSQQYDFNKAMLADVLRFLATDAGISFF